MTGRSGLIGAVIRIIETLSLRYPKMVIVCVVILLIAAGLQIEKVRINNDPLSYFQDDHPFVRDATTLHHEVAGLKVFSVVLRSDKDRYFASPEGISRIAAAQTALDAIGAFDKTRSLADIIKLMHQEYHAGDTAFYRIPNDPEDVDLYLSSMMRKDIESFVTEDFKRARIIIRHNMADSVALNGNPRKLPAAVANFDRGGRPIFFDRQKSHGKRRRGIVGVRSDIVFDTDTVHHFRAVQFLVYLGSPPDCCHWCPTSSRCCSILV